MAPTTLARSSKRSAAYHKLARGNVRDARDVLERHHSASMHISPKANIHLVCAEATAPPHAVAARVAKLSSVHWQMGSPKPSQLALNAVCCKQFAASPLSHSQQVPVPV